jgi:hypothetical protein
MGWQITPTHFSISDNIHTTFMGNREHHRANKHAREKIVQTAIKREWLLSRQSWREPIYEELSKPVFWGYKREFVLRDDVALRNDASKWRSLLVLLQNEQFSKRKDFKVRRRPSRKWLTREHRLKTFSTWDFERKIPNKFKVYFRFYNAAGRRRYYFIHPWMMVSRRIKEYNTHRKLLNPEIEWELSYLKDRIDQNLYRQTYSKMKGRGFSYRGWNRPRKERLLDQYHQAQMQEALLMHFEGEIKPTNSNNHA